MRFGLLVDPRSVQKLWNKILDAPKMDVIAEETAGAGVTIDGLLIKDGVMTGSAQLGVANKWTKQQNFNATTLTDGANISWDLDDNQTCSVTLAGNRTLDNPTNMVDGSTYLLKVIQDGTGSRTLSYGSAYDFQSGTAPILTTTAGAYDLFSFYCDGSKMLGVVAYDFS